MINMELIEFTLTAVVTGFVLSLMIGPLFFVLLETSLTKGIKAAIALDLGVLISDLLYILIAYVFYAEVSSIKYGSGTSTDIIHVLGGGVFIAYGIYSILKKVNAINENKNEASVPQRKEYIGLFVKGFVLNLANPLVIFYWFSIMTLATSQSYKGHENNGLTLVIFITLILVTFFSIDLLKIIGAKYLRPLVTKSLLKSLNKLIGIVFIVFGLYLLFKLF